MPIKREFRHLYGPEWKRISHEAVVRAGYRCQRCGLPNYAHVRRQDEDEPEILDAAQVELARREHQLITRIILTVAHLDHDPENNAPENLSALCQKCHLEHDRQQHISNARQTRISKADSERKLLRLMMGLPPEPPPDPATARKPRKPRYQRGSLTQRHISSRLVWYAQWWQDGGRRTKILGPCAKIGRGEATAMLAQILDPLNQAAGVTPGSRVVTFREFVMSEYLPLKATVWKLSTERNAETGIRQHLLPEFGARLLGSITRRDLQGFIQTRAPKYSRSVVGKLKVWLGDIFTLALADGLIQINPASAIQIPRTCKPKETRPALSIEEARVYLSALATRERLLARLCLVEGMRKGEAFALMWKDIDEAGINLQRRVYNGVMDTPKSGRARTCGLSQGTRELLKLWQAETEFNGPEHLVFQSRITDAPVSPETAWKVHFLPRLKAHGLEWATFHVLRHTNATLMRKLGIDAKVGSDQRGHGIGMSLDLYTHSDAEQKGSAVQELDDAISKETGKP